MKAIGGQPAKLEEEHESAVDALRVEIRKGLNAHASYGCKSERCLCQTMTKDQLSLLGAAPGLPEGFKYQLDVISPDDERRLLDQVRELPLRDFQFHGFTEKRRVISDGWKYDFEERAVQQAEDIPEWLLPLREAAAGFAGIVPDHLQQALVTEYDIGAAIGWHRDKAVFGDVVGISLLSSCRFRLRRKAGTKWERASLMADARSAYLLRGPSRTEWEHSIPAVDALRYSITFRNLLEETQPTRRTRSR